MKKNFIFNLSITAVFFASVAFLFFCEREEEYGIFVSSVKNGETVIIDAGHGGEDGGAVGTEDLLEKDINLSVAEKLELILNLYGADTDMTRRSDISLGDGSGKTLRQRKASDIKKRVEKILCTADAVVISIHQNSFPEDARCFGAQVFYSENNIESKPLAGAVQKSLKNGISNNNTRVEKASDKKIYLLENVNCPAILVECGFLTNAEERTLLADENYKTRLAACVASGFFEYKNEM